MGTKTDKVTKVQHDGVGERTNDKPNSGGGIGGGGAYKRKQEYDEERMVNRVGKR